MDFLAREESRSTPATFTLRQLDFARLPLDDPEQLLTTRAFAQWTESAPHATAIRWRRQTWSYHTLSERSNAIAYGLTRRGLKRGGVVAVTGDPSFGLIAALLGVLQSGGILLPLDPRLPLRRRQVMLREAHAAFLLSVGHDCACESIARIAIDPDIGFFPDLQVSPGPWLSHPRPGDPAYVFFTSGSTATPKGVLGCHKSLAHFLNWQRDTFSIEPADRIAQLTALSFDPVLRDVFLPLSSGGILCLPDRVVAGGGACDFAEWMFREAISVLHTGPSLAQAFLDTIDVPVELPDLRWVFFAGEPLQSSLVERWRKAFPGRYQVVNLYGPTETTMAKLYFTVPDPPLPGVQPLGCPLPQTQALVLDGAGEVCACGEAGEIVIRTPFRTLGYLNSPAEQASRFTLNPNRDDPADLLFKTGDRGRYREDGNLEFLGRLDDQVKIRGVLVNPTSVMDVLEQHPEVRYSFVFAKDDVLKAFVVCRKESATTAAELRLHLADYLPTSNVPVNIHLLERPPLQPNGKIDRTALLAGEESSSVLSPISGLPRNDIEQALTAIWTNLLLREQIGIHDDFFELGGHSLTAIRILARVRSRFKTELEIRDFFAAPTIAQMAHLIEQRRGGLAASTPSAEKVVESPVEAAGRVVAPAPPDTVYPRGSVPELFERQVKERPQAVALVHRDRRITYQELDLLANSFAHELFRRDLPAEAIVALAMDRSPELVAAMLGALKAGAAYLPLDSSYPPERLQLLLADSSARLLITQASLMERFPHWSGATLLAGDLPVVDQPAPQVTLTPESLAYVMYTSGSTGMPKGVEIPHRGIIRLVFGNDYARFGPDRVFLQMAPVSFDASTFEIWGALLHGGTCVLYPEIIPTPSALAAVLRSEAVTTLWLTSSLFNALIDDDPMVLKTVEQLLIGGEALSVSHVARALEKLPDTQLINGYGPTECTTFACCYPIPRCWTSTPNTIPIGRPIARTEVHILDEHLAAVPSGQPGELYLGGDGVARGYRNRPELNRAAFVPNPLGSEQARLFKTGDMVRCRPDGNLEFLGRVDDQVKIRGFRIEPGEIEAALARHPAVAQAAVQVFERQPGDKYLAAYLVLSAGQSATAADLRAFLTDRLPAYMVPSWFQLMDRLPVTANGKLDKRALPLPDGTRRSPSSKASSTPLRQVSFSQENLWLHDRLYPGIPAYNVCRALELEGRVDRNALAGALHAIVERHSVLHSTFKLVGGVPMQAVSPAWPSPLRELDLSSNPGGYPAALRAEAERPFDLASDLLLRALLIRLAPAQNVLVLTFHHIAVDGWSLSILFRELSQLYSMLTLGIAPSLPQIPLQYADYAEMERDRLSRGEMNSALHYWRRQLHGAKTLLLPLDHPNTPAGRFRAGTLETQIKAPLLFRLDQLARRSGATLFIVLLAAFKALLHRSSGQEDILVGTPVANRLREESEDLIGFFTNTLVARSRVQDSQSFCDLISIVREVMLDAYGYQDVPFEKLAEIIQSADSLYPVSVLQAIFVLQNTPAMELHLAGIRTRLTNVDNGTAKVNLTVSIEQHGDQLILATEYNADLFEAGTIARLMASFNAFLEAIAADPRQAISSPRLPELPTTHPPRARKSHRKPTGMRTGNALEDDLIERRLSRMWGDILGVRTVSADDNFFALGGHSLMAARLIGRIEKEFGIKLGLNALFQAPTPSRLAPLIRTQFTPSQADIIPIQPAGALPPFHCLHGGPMYFCLARLLGPDQPFLGVHALDPDAVSSPFRLEDYAAVQAQSIRQVQPDGPYCLGGWSAAAALAYEVAQQLRAQGQEVSLVVLFDGLNPAVFQGEVSRERFRDRFTRIASRGRFHLLNLARGGITKALPYLDDRWKWLLLLSRIHAWSMLYRIYQRLGFRLPRWMRYSTDILIHCFYRYQPKPYHGRVLLFRHGSRPEGSLKDPLLGWGACFAGEFEVCEIPGNHREIFEEPNVQIMAEKLSATLREVRESALQPAGRNS